MKKIIFLIVLFFGLNSQAQVYSLSEDPGDLHNGMYIKDIDNLLSVFEGKWETYYEGNKIVLSIDKVIKHPIKSLDINYESDVLFMRYTVEDAQGNKIASTMDNNITDANIISIAANKYGEVGFSYKGEECGIGMGGIFLTITNHGNNLGYEFQSNGGLIDLNQCPNAKNIKSYIPRTKSLYFSKTN